MIELSAESYPTETGNTSLGATTGIKLAAVVILAPLYYYHLLTDLLNPLMYKVAKMVT